MFFDLSKTHCIDQPSHCGQCLYCLRNNLHKFPASRTNSVAIPPGPPHTWQVFIARSLLMLRCNFSYPNRRLHFSGSQTNRPSQLPISDDPAGQIRSRSIRTNHRSGLFLPHLPDMSPRQRHDPDRENRRRGRLGQNPALQRADGDERPSQRHRPYPGYKGVHGLARNQADFRGAARGDGLRRTRIGQARRLLGGLGGTPHRAGEREVDSGGDHQCGVRMWGAASTWNIS
jgi:hypothetical protein